MNHRALITSLLAVVVAVVSAHVVARLALAAAPLGSALGLITLYVETAAIAVGLAALRVRNLEVRSSPRRTALVTPLPRASRANVDDHRPDKSAA